MVYNYRNKQRSIDGYRWSLMIMKWNLRQLPSVTTHLPDHSVASWALLWRLRAHCEVPVSWDTVAGVDRTNRIIGDSLKINLSIKRLITIISEIQWLHTISVRCLALRCLLSEKWFAVIIILLCGINLLYKNFCGFSTETNTNTKIQNCEFINEMLIMYGTYLAQDHVLIGFIRF
jgi:hypothetical protein